MKKATALLKSPLSVISISVIVLFLISVPVYFIARTSVSFADFLNVSISHVMRAHLGAVSRIFPFSLFELLVIFSVPLVVLAVFVGIRFYMEVWGRVRFILAIVALIALFATSYIYTLGIGYHTTAMSTNLGLDNITDIEKDELTATYLTVLYEVNRNAELIGSDGTESHMAYSLSELSDKLSESYRSLDSEYDFLKVHGVRVKPVLLSSVMSDAGILGIYSFFTGEPNLNIEYPDYVLPFTAAHELAHSFGIARENEANFMAFLACINSQDPYIRYSGYLNMYEYLAAALNSVDGELYLELKSELSDTAREDLLASREVSIRHKDSPIRKINDKLNDFYLKSNGTEGVVTYSYVVRLAVSYYRSN